MLLNGQMSCSFRTLILKWITRWWWIVSIVKEPDLGAILSDCRIMLATSFVNSHVKFIKRRTNEVAHRLTQVA
jgi:hypothetical protein